MMEGNIFTLIKQSVSENVIKYIFAYLYGLKQ